MIRWISYVIQDPLYFYREPLIKMDMYNNLVDDILLSLKLKKKKKELLLFYLRILENCIFSMLVSYVLCIEYFYYYMRPKRKEQMAR